MYQIYKVKPEERLEDLAKRFHTTKEELIRLNGLSSEEIKPEMFIIVPKKETDVLMTYKILPGDTLFSLAEKHHVSVDSLQKVNGLNKDDYIYPGEEILIPRENTSFYITKEGDDLEKLQKVFGKPIADILLQNETIYLAPEQFLVYKKRE